MRPASAARVPSWLCGTAPDARTPVEGVAELVGGQARLVDLSRDGEDGLDVGAVAQGPGVEPPGGDGVLDVVDRVGDVVGPVHDLGLDAAAGLGGALAEPGEDRQVVVVDAELHRGVGGVAAAPRVLRRGVEAGPGEVEPGGAAVGVEALGLQAGEDAQGLGVALEPADARGEGVEGGLAVVPERRVAEVVGEAGGVDDVGAAAERRAELATDLGDLEGVGQPVADEVVAARLDDLRLGAEPPQRRGVHEAGPVAGEVVAVGALEGGVLAHPPLAVASRVGLAVPLDGGHGLTLGVRPPLPRRPAAPRRARGRSAGR